MPGNGLLANHERDVRAVVVVCPEPLRGVALGLLDAFDDVLVEPLMPNRAVVAFDVGVLLGLSWLDVLDGDAPFLGPDQQLATDVFRAVVDPCGAGLAAPLDVEEDQETVRGTVSPTTGPGFGLPVRWAVRSGPRCPSPRG